MCVHVVLAPSLGRPADFRYTVDPETGILAGRAAPADRRVVRPVQRRADWRSIELEGRDGSWLTLDVHDGRLDGVVVVIWPRARVRPLSPPADAPLHAAHVSAGPRTRDLPVEVSARIRVEVDAARRIVHFSLAPARAPALADGAPEFPPPHVAEPAPVGRAGAARTVRLANDLLADVAPDGHVAGLWLLNVPPDSLPIP